jgi:hypothetical protein
MIFVAGLSLAVYMPLVPFLIFTFMVIAWLIAVIETMIAAPLVALALAFPEGGHMAFGRAALSVQLILNVFARPMLMIFGLVAAVVVSFVAINFVNGLYGIVVTDVGSGISTGLNTIYKAAYIIIYVSIVLTILNRSFSLIHIFPDRILSWIGWQRQFGEYRGGEDKVEARFDAARKGVGGGWVAGGFKAGASRDAMKDIHDQAEASRAEKKIRAEKAAAAAAEAKKPKSTPV